MASSAIDTFDVMVKAEKKGVAYDQNPVQIETDEHCRAVLKQLMSQLPAGAYDQDLLKSCLAVVSAKDGDEFTFGPAQLVALGDLSAEFPAYAHEILACMDHITASLDFEGDVPPEVFKMAASAHAMLGEATAAVAAASLSVDPTAPTTSAATSLLPPQSDDSMESYARILFGELKSKGLLPAEVTFDLFLADMIDEGADMSDEDDETEETETDGAHKAAYGAHIQSEHGAELKEPAVSVPDKSD
jgi:hypothetical protein